MKVIKLKEVMEVLVKNEELISLCSNPLEFIPTGWENLDDEQLDMFDSHMDMLMSKVLKNAA